MTNHPRPWTVAYAGGSPTVSDYMIQDASGELVLYVDGRSNRPDDEPVEETVDPDDRLLEVLQSICNAVNVCADLERYVASLKRGEERQGSET